MHSWHITSFGTADGLERRSTPEPAVGPSEVLVRVRASSLNYRDLQILHQISPAPPQPGVIPLIDAAGEVVAVGPDVTRFTVGDRVCTTYYPRWIDGPLALEYLDLAHTIGANVDGVLAEAVVRDEDGLVRLPDHLSFEEGATLPCAAVTAWTALHGTRPVGPGDVVLVQGSGGVALFALQLAQLFGARVLAITSTDQKAEGLLAHGASDVINHHADPSWPVRVRELTGGRGVDCVIDVGGAETFERALQVVAVGGRLVVVGQLSREANIPIAKLRVPGMTMEFPTVGSRATFEAMNRAIAAHRVHPVIDSVFPFAEAPRAFEHFEARRAHFGKIVIRHQ